MMRQRKDTATFHTCTDCTPGNEITDDNPELFAAAEKTIDTRLSAGGGHTGWSRAWIACFFARLKKGGKVYENT